MLLKPKYTDNVKDIVFFVVCKMYFPTAFQGIEAFDSKELINTLKKGITSSMKCVDLATFTFAT